MATIMEQVANVEPQKRFGQMLRNLRVEYEKRGLPLMGRFELTPHCTLDCKMCYVHRSDGKYPHRVLTGDEWIDIMDQAIDMGMLHATLTGGECMLHPDFKRIYMRLKEKGVHITILTNGTLLDKEMIEFLATVPPIFLQISVYGSSPEVYERVTGDANAFYKVDFALRELMQTNLLPQIALTISKYNLDDLSGLWQYANSFDQTRVIVDCDLIAPIESSGHNFEDYSLSYEEQLSVRTQVLAWKGRETGKLCDEDFLEGRVDDSQERYNKMPCAAGLSAFHIGYDGVMLPCGEFPLAKADVLADGFADAWKKINIAAKMYHRSEECLACAFFDECTFCAARYANSSGSTDGLAGNIPCNKKMRMLIPMLYRKSK
ncbi:MAG: radical SAM protein [Clostridia bacterium]|nr:radical SAM protein [Clostridia bacterium]